MRISICGSLNSHSVNLPSYLTAPPSSPRSRASVASAATDAAICSRSTAPFAAAAAATRSPLGFSSAPRPNRPVVPLAVNDDDARALVGRGVRPGDRPPTRSLRLPLPPPLPRALAAAARAATEALARAAAAALTAFIAATLDEPGPPTAPLTVPLGAPFTCASMSRASEPCGRTVPWVSAVESRGSRPSAGPGGERRCGTPGRPRTSSISLRIRRRGSYGGLSEVGGGVWANVITAELKADLGMKSQVEVVQVVCCTH